MSSFQMVGRTCKAIQEKEPNIKKFYKISSWRGRLVCLLNLAAYTVQIFTDPPYFIYRAFKHLVKSAGFFCLSTTNRKVFRNLKINLIKVEDDFISLAFSPIANLIMIHKFIAGIIHPGICYRAADKEECKLIKRLTLFEVEAKNISEKVIGECYDFTLSKKSYHHLMKTHAESKQIRKEFLNKKLYII